MASIRQIDANRRNAERSTGPRTQEGKQSSSQNALQSGISAEKEVLPFEDPTQLDSLISGYQERFNPTTPEAWALVDSLVHHEWLLRRLRRAEAALYYCECAACAKNYSNQSECTVISGRLSLEFKKFDHLQRRINATERNYHRSLKALQALHPPLEPERAEDLKPVAAPSQPEEPKPTSTKLASFPQNAFLLVPSAPASAPSAIDAQPQTLEDSEPEPSSPATLE